MATSRFLGRYQQRLFTAVMALLLVPPLLSAANEAPAAKDTDNGVGAVKRQTLKGFTFFYKSAETNMDGIRETVEKIIPEMHKALTEGGVAVRGPLVFIYHGASPDPKVTFTMEIGMQVAQGTKPVGDFKVRDVPDYNCASVIYTGPLSGLGGAFEKLYGEAAPKATDEAREMYLYFESPDSPNNVIHVSAGQKD
jgi:hypothetical protein